MNADISAAARSRRADRRRAVVGPLLLKVLALGTVVGTAFALTPSLVGQERWLFLAAIWVIAGVLVATYATGRGLPAKYLVPGGLLLTLFVVYPIVMTGQLSATNFGDGTRTSKDETVARIIASSVQQTPDAPRYNLAIATSGTPQNGPYAFFLVDPGSGSVFLGTPEGLEQLDPGDVTIVDDFVTEPPTGFTLLTPSEVNAAGPELAEFAVPTDRGAIRQLGISQAFEGRTTLEYDEARDTIIDTETGTEFTPQQVGDREYYQSESGQRISDQSWLAYVGFDNYLRVFGDDRIRNDFLRIFVWTVLFATLSVGSTFLLGFALAVALNDRRLRGQKIYRAILVLPYAIPGFISLLIWASFFNRDFGLINQVTGLDVNWFGDPTLAKGAVLLVNLWMGFPYMFLVCTGALQAIPEELKEAAELDGAGGFTRLRLITLPLLLVGVAPLLVASFAFNFNNFNAIALLTQGGPFSPDNPTAGGTDILISYTIRLAFGAGGAQIGFASAISVLLFILTGVIAALQFRATKSLEEVH
ncbi:ABC transporter permease subunit [Nocardioides limicola]|uniref:ABC transporter permease subunit n=1 Tax=Nocardioides limicola TaxID=2803368 RepID=UPI00193B6104|nr:ABC transporter permease subunit [Nocardioides sp. DJM-14]